MGKIPDLGRCELARGRIVAASPTYHDHGRVELNIASALSGFVKPRRLGQVLTGEVGIFTGRDPDTVRGADVAFTSTERLALVPPAPAFLDVAPDLVVEVLSPSDRPGKLRARLREYFAIGVRLVWAADTVRRTVRVYRSLDDVLPGFRLPVAEAFE